MKIAISLPDELFERAEELARRFGKSRSQIFAEALREYVFRHDPDAVVEALDRVVEDAEPEEGDRSFLDRAARRVLEQTDW